MDLINRHRVLRGPSLYACRPVLICLFIILGIGLLMLVGLSMQGGANPSPSQWSAITTVGGFSIGWALLSLLASMLVTARLRAELAEGYTTTPFGYFEVDLVDPHTGIILRKAGEPLIDRKTFLERRTEARLAEKAHSSSRERR